MGEELSDRAFRRRGRRGLRRMSALQRSIFWAVRFEEGSCAELAERYGISADQVRAEFRESLDIFFDALGENEPWWRRW